MLAKCIWKWIIMQQNIYQLNKIFDFSSKTINKFKESGYNNVQDLTDVEYQGE
jgi:hypothetical protein